MNKALCEGPWMFGKSSLALQKWALNLILDESFFVSALVWMCLLSLSLEHCNEEVFKGIAKSFGELLSIDPMTTAKSRLVFARIYINVNQMTDMSHSIDIISKLGKWSQAIEYESLSFTCFHCKKWGIGLNHVRSRKTRKTRLIATTRTKRPSK